MIRVLQVIDNMNAGGMETMIMNYYKNINKEKIQFDFLIFHKEKCLYEDEILKLGGKIYKITPRRENILKNRLEVKNFFKENHYDIVEFHQGITYFYPLKIAYKYKIPNRVIHNHGIDRRYLKFLSLYNNLYAKPKINRLATAFFSCSNKVDTQLFTQKSINSPNYHIINNALDVSNYVFNEKKREKIREELKIKNTEIVVGHVGSFTYPKNHKFIINVFNELNKINSNYKLLLVGNGPLYDEIMSYSKSLNLNDKIIYLSNRKDVNDILSAMDLFLFPSIFEGLPFAVLEALSSGLPTYISSTINEDAFAIKNGQIISLEMNAEQWANIIHKCKTVNSRKKCNILMSKTKFNIKTETEKLQNIYISMNKFN